MPTRCAEPRLWVVHGSELVPDLTRRVRISARIAATLPTLQTSQVSDEIGFLLR
jgi:hypothetical protein